MRYCSTFQTMSGSCSTLPYIGSKISLISNSDIRYEGILYTINTQESTVALQDVRSYGTEGRKFPDIPGSSEVFDFIIFRGKDIKDLTVCEPAKIHDDPAIVSMNIPPSRNIGDGMNSLPLSGGVNNNQIGTGCGINTNIGVTGSQIPPIGRVDRVYSNCQGIGYQRGTGGNAGRFGGGSASNCSGISSSYGRSSMMNGHVSHGRGGGGRSGGYGGGYGHNRGSRHVVGELVAQPNQSVKSEVACDFDFDEANAKFEKAGCIRSGKGLEVGGNGCGLGSGGLSDGNIGAGGGNLRNAESVVGSLGIIGGYDKKTSFFDNISCETLDRQHGRDEKINREKQRALDAETFGVIATQYRSFRSSYRRSGGPGRSGGGNDVGSSSIGGMGSLSGGGPGGSGIGNSSGASAARNFRGYGYSRGIGGGYGSKGIGYNSQYGSGASTNLGIGYAQHRYPAY